ncbi:uncharacterized protein N7459_000359 [Penicillium hispanicum]|uniref:uncharacterized protein n=1 Tax=Penicillium hispanicum TaxID=1080232 RepID=UPI00253F72B0|nr:uncharacterized protein N7459_000359 [Penicillium hispanicum]KAJ5594151.1 hypothetical protein N7459_000359 [Penicillium hispanicum]
MTGIKKPRGIRHDRHCHGCRVKGIKCDLNRPRCQSCQQSGTTCSYPQRVVWIGEKKPATPKAASKSPCSSPATTSASEQHAGELHTTKNIPVNLYGFIDLLSHFYQEINLSNKELPHEGVELISRTLSFARARLQGANNQQSIQSHLGALMNLSKVIESAHPIALFAIATFAIFEVCCGSFGKWHRHLQGARSLLDLHCRDKKDFDGLAKQIPGLADVLAYLVWFDVTGALVRQSALIFGDWHRGILCAAFFDSVGCPPDTFELFAYLAKPDVDIDVVDLSSRAMDQVLRLSTVDSTERGLAAVVYRCTGAIVAFGRVGDSSSNASQSFHSDVISSMVDRVCNAISDISTGSRFYVHLATPAYLTGMHASTVRQCETLRAYWRNCQMCDFPRYPDAQEQCERRWRSRMIC